MSTFTFGSTTVTIDPAYRALGGAMRGMAKNVFSFQVKKLDEGQWYLITNRQNFIGRYPSQVAAISVLYGIMTFNDGLDSGVEAWLNESITSGSSEIDPDVNIIQFSTSAVETVVSVSEYDAAQALLSSGAPNDGGGYFLGYQLSSDGITWDAVNVSNVIGAALDGNVNQTRTSSGSTVWDNITENQYYRGVLMVADSGNTFYVASTSSIGVKDEVDDTDLTALTMVISGSSTEGDAVTLGGYAYSVVDSSGAILDPGETISYTYNWYREIPTLTGLSGGSSGVAPTFNATPTASATNPTVGDSVSVLTYAASGTPTPTVTFEWFVNAVSQAETTDTFDTTGLSGTETLTCTVTASNGVSPDATANVDFGTVAAAAEIVGTCTSWFVSAGPTIRNANGWVAGSAGSGSIDMELRDDFRGAFIYFATGAEASAFVSANASKDVTITHSSGVYSWDHTLATMTVFATVYVQLPLTGWSGTLPGASDAATVTVS